MGETSRGLSPGEVNKKKVSKVDQYKELSEEAMGYNLRDDLRSETVMDYLRGRARGINQANKRSR